MTANGNSHRDAAWLGLVPGVLQRALAGRPIVQRILGNSAWLAGDRILRMGLGVLVGVWMARYLGPGGFGLLGVALAFVDLSSSVARLGLDSIVVHDLVRDPDRAGRTLGTAAALRLAGGLLATCAAAAAAHALRPDQSVLPLLVVLAAASLWFQPADAVDFWFQSRTQSRPVVLARGAAFALTSLLRVALILSCAPLPWFAAAIAAESALAAAGLAWVYRRAPDAPSPWRLSASRARELLAASWPMIASGFAILIYMRVDQIMLGRLRDDAAAGLYAAAVRLSEVWYFIPAALVSSAFPAIVEAKRTSEPLYRGRLRALFGSLAFAAVALGLAMTLLSGPLVARLFGPAYREAGPILAIYIWCALFVFWGLAQGPWFIAEGLLKLSVFRTFAAAAMKILLNLLLIPRWSGLGAALASVIAYAYIAWWSNALNPRTRALFFDQTRSLFCPWTWWKPVRRA